MLSLRIDIDCLAAGNIRATPSIGFCYGVVSSDKLSEPDYWMDPDRFLAIVKKNSLL